MGLVKLRADSDSAKAYTNREIEYTLIYINGDTAELSYERNAITHLICVPVEDVEQVEDTIDAPFLDPEVKADMETIMFAIDDHDQDALEAFSRIYDRMEKLI